MYIVQAGIKVYYTKTTCPRSRGGTMAFEGYEGEDTRSSCGEPAMGSKFPL